MTSVQILNSQTQNVSKTSIYETTQAGRSEFYQELSSVNLSNNQTETSIDPSKNICCPNNCQRCFQLERRIKELESKIKKLAKELQPTIANRFQGTVKGATSSRSRNGISKDENVLNKEGETEQLKDSMKILRFSYAIDEKVLEKQRKMLLQIQERADKLSRKEKRERFILKQMIQKQHTSFQVSPRRSPQPLRLSLSDQKSIPQLIQNFKKTTVAPIPSSFNNFKEEIPQFLKNQEPIIQQNQKIQPQVNIEPLQKSKQLDIDIETKQQIDVKEQKNIYIKNDVVQTIHVPEKNEETAEIIETKIETLESQQTQSIEPLKIEIVSEPIKQQIQVAVQQAQQQQKIEQEQTHQQLKIEQVHDFKKEKLEPEILGNQKVPQTVFTKQSSPSKVKRAQSYNVPIQFLTGFQAQEQQQQKKHSLKKSNSQILDNIPQTNQSQLEQFMMKDIEGQKYGEFDIFKSNGASPKLDSSAISVSSKGKSVTSNMNPKELESHYNTKMRNSKLLAKLKKKK